MANFSLFSICSLITVSCFISIFGFVFSSILFPDLLVFSNLFISAYIASLETLYSVDILSAYTSFSMLLSIFDNTFAISFKNFIL